MQPVGDQQEGAYLASRFREPAAAATVKANGGLGEKLGAIAGILSLVMVGAILALLYLNWDLIKNA